MSKHRCQACIMRTDKPKLLFIVSLFWVVFASVFLGLTTPSYATMHSQSSNPQIEEGIRDALSRIPGAELKRLLIQQFDTQEAQSSPIDQSDISIEIESKSTPLPLQFIIEHSLFLNSLDGLFIRFPPV